MAGRKRGRERRICARSSVVGPALSAGLVFSHASAAGRGATAGTPVRYRASKMHLDLPIKTRRLELRDFREDDIVAVHAYRSDPQVTRFMFFAPDSLEDTRTHMSAVLEAKSKQPRRVWELAVVRLSDACVIGGCDLTCEASDQADLGYILSRDAWEQGYATEIAQTLVERGFLDLGLRRIFATCDAENHASRRVLIKAGLRFESVIKRHEDAKNRWWDSELYAIYHDDRSTIRAGTAGVGHR